MSTGVSFVDDDNSCDILVCMLLKAVLFNGVSLLVANPLLNAGGRSILIHISSWGKFRHVFP